MGFFGSLNFVADLVNLLGSVSVSVSVSQFCQCQLLCRVCRLFFVGWVCKFIPCACYFRELLKILGC